MTARRLAYVCKILGFGGCWMPDSFTSRSKRILYSTYSGFVWFVMYWWTISQILDLIIQVKSQDEFTDIFYATMANGCICAKFTNVLLTRRYIADMIDRIETEPFASLSVEEEQIRTRFDKLARRNAVAYTVIISCYILPTCVTGLFVGFRDHKLLSRAWLPYDYYSSNVSFGSTLIHQVGAQVYAGCITTGSDCLFNGFLMHTYCHFEILKHRLKMIVPGKNYTVKRCSYLHDHIYTYATTVNRRFKIIIMIQSVVTIVTVCCTLYQLTQVHLGSRFVEVTLYLTNTLIQIFYYCWYGNEIKLKSLDVSDFVFQCNWINLDNDGRKLLVMMIKRARVPIEFSAIHIVSMDLEMFTTILKTSYSAYNLLQ